MPPAYGSFMKVPPGDMPRHVAFCMRALADGGAADIGADDRSDVMPLWMRRYRSRSPRLELQLSSGYLGRAVIAELDATLAREGVACARRLTPKTQRLSQLIVRYDADDSFTPLAVVNTLDTVSRMLGLQPPFLYTIWHRGPFDPAYIFAPDDPVTSPLSYRAGRAVGYTIRKIAKIFSPNDQKT
jgi:hypothetical protein